MSGIQRAAKPGLPDLAGILRRAKRRKAALTVSQSVTRRMPHASEAAIDREINRVYDGLEFQRGAAATTFARVIRRVPTVARNPAFWEKAADDGFLYHVTSTRRVPHILRDALRGGMPKTFTNQPGAGRAFLTEKKGVPFWEARVGDHLHANHDDPPGVAVLRVRKAGLKLLPDVHGTADARAAAYTVDGPVSKKRKFSAIDTSPHLMKSVFFSLAQYKQFKKTADEDKDRGLLNAHKAGLAGALAAVVAGPGAPAAPGAGRLAGGLARMRATPLRRSAAGYAGGQLAVQGVRLLTGGTKDVYGDRSRRAKHAEKVPAYGALAGAALLAKKRLTGQWFTARTLPGRVHLFADGEKEKRALPPWAKMGLSGAVTGSVLGAATVGLRRGNRLPAVLRAAALGGGLTGGGSALAGVIGGRILGPARAGEGAAYTKRGAVGGAVGGSALGVGAALYALKTAGGRARLARLSKTFRPAHWVGAAKPLAGVGVAATVGGAAGAYQAADEGAGLDAVTGLNKPRRLTARLRAILFSRQQIIRDNWAKADPLAVASGEQKGYTPRVTASGQYDRDAHSGKIRLDPVNIGVSNAQVLRAAYNQGKTLNRYGGRGVRLIKDASDSFRGQPKVDDRGRPLKKEWDKSWARHALGAAAIGAGLIGHAHAMKKFPRYRAGVIQTKMKVKAQINKVVPDTFPTFSARIGGRLVTFDWNAESKGWDVRDPRGRSARVFAPGSRARERREKKSYETVGFLRKAAVVGAVGSLALGLGGGYLLGKRSSTGGLRLVPPKIKKPIRKADILKHPNSAPFVAASAA